MKYNPKPYRKPMPPKIEDIIVWNVDFDNEGYEFDNQEEAMIFCLLLEMRDILNEIKEEIHIVEGRLE